MLAVHRQIQALSCLAQHFRIIISVHQQDILQRQYAAAEELSGLAVEHHHIAVVEQPQPSRNGDAQRGGVFWIYNIHFIGKRAHREIISCNSHSFFRHFQLDGDFFPQAAELTAAAG